MVFCRPRLLPRADLTPLKVRASWRRPLTWLALVVPSLAWGLFCRGVNGHWLPNTCYIKAQPFHFGGDELRTAWQLRTGQGWASRPVFVLGWVAFVGWLVVRREPR